MKIAVFADLHGKILLPFKLVDLYQTQTGEKIDLILQCGDAGIFPDTKKLDRATLKHAKTDRDELGFADDFMVLKPQISRFLEKLNLQMICVRGNHEDHDFLDNLESQSEQDLFSVDVYKRVWVCKTGKMLTFTAGNQTLTVVGIGRTGDRKGRMDQRFIQPYEKLAIKKLIKTKETPDLLITHDRDPQEYGYGMTEIRDILDEMLFHYHFYGHTGQHFQQETDLNGYTTSVKIKELEFNEDGILEKGCMLIVTKINDTFHLEVVTQKLTNLLTKFNWKLIYDSEPEE